MYLIRNLLAGLGSSLNLAGLSPAGAERLDFPPPERYSPEVMKPKLPSPPLRAKSRSRQKPTRVSKSKANTRTDNVFPMDRNEQPGAPRPRVIAHDTKTQRVIIGIGGQRLAFDFTTRVTKLKPGTGDAPAPVSILKRRKGEPGPVKKPKKEAVLQRDERISPRFGDGRGAD